MAGSYNHIVNEEGKLYSPDNTLVENLGDAYEAIEEMYGMIWYLADVYGHGSDLAPIVEVARQNYKSGLKMSPGVEDD